MLVPLSLTYHPQAPFPVFPVQCIRWSSDSFLRVSLPISCIHSVPLYEALHYKLTCSLSPTHSHSSHINRSHSQPKIQIHTTPNYIPAQPRCFLSDKVIKHTGYSSLCSDIESCYFCHLKFMCHYTCSSGCGYAQSSTHTHNH